VPAESVLAPAGPADLDALLPMLERFNAGEGIAFDAAVARRALGELLARPELGRVFRIVEAGATVGYGALTFGWSLEWGGRDAFIDEIYLELPQRGRGLGRTALRALMAEACALGVRALHLEVDAENAPAQALYRAEGFSGSERRLLSRRLS
jgi:ribosomal protein S18 acetylase RimI-like enzyme